ncbi:PREDICTED: uncharacterized protein LOC109359586 [Lupinus angustifolius]|uniref:uncharacterized protein LOC109359586 n=1 Tax=Lupinus angustifolius TaxID=3871 RepID=UPI00092E77B6|nr:PREDICTED: uncharacterized protein LOC109359586 [Lupinus angustifolius]
MALESEKVVQEFTYSDSDKRKKLDGFTLFFNEGAKDMIEANLGKRDLKSLESESKYDLRKSLAWDSAFSTSPGFLEPEELFNTSNSGHSQYGCDILGHEVHQLLSAKYPEPETKSVIDEVNLRKSLAWDSAFSTCEGVLNPEELSLVNKGFKKSEIHILPRTEELWMSYESNCTIDSDGSSLASLEVELFADIRASIPHLGEASSTFVPSSRKERYINMQKFNSTKKVDEVPKLKVKLSPTPGRQTINGNQPEKLTKESSTSVLRKKFSAESAVSDTYSLLKPPKIVGRRRNIPLAPTKRVSLVSNDVIGERKIIQATDGKCLIVKPNPGKTCSDNRSSSQASEISSLIPRSSTNESKVLHSPYRQFYTRGSPLKSSAIKNDLNLNSTACNCTSTLTPPSECRITDQITPDNCDHKCHGSMTCTDSDATAQSGLEVQRRGQSSVLYDDKGSMCRNPCTEIKGSKFVSSDTSRNVKPSGLRMLPPKLGFFDVDDSLMPIENGGGKLHSGMQNAVSKVGFCSRSLNMYNRLRPGKIQNTQTMKDIKTTNIFHQQTKRSITSRTKKSTSSLAPVSKAQSEPHCVEKSKDYLRNDLHILHEDEKENIIDFESNLKYLHEQVRTLGVSGDVVIEFDAKNGSS